MNESERLAGQMERALNGNAWHGPSWREALDGVTLEAALHRPIPAAHTIAEIVRHAATWHDVVRRRLAGESPEVSDAEDWPEAAFGSDAAWALAVEHLLETGRELCGSVARFSAERLHEKRPGIDDTWHGLILGELQHMLYHAGQVSLLKKATRSA
jgi:hypothetical protein